MVSKGFVDFFDEVVEVGGNGDVDWLQGCLEVDFGTTGSWKRVGSGMAILGDLCWISTVRLGLGWELPRRRGYRPTYYSYTGWRYLQLTACNGGPNYKFPRAYPSCRRRISITKQCLGYAQPRTIHRPTSRSRIFKTKIPSRRDGQYRNLKSRRN